MCRTKERTEKKMKTERIGIGVSFNKDMNINEIDLEEELIHFEEVENSDMILQYQELSMAQINVREGELPQLLEEEAGIESRRKKKRTVRRKKADSLEVLKTHPSLGMENFSRDKSPMGA